MSECASQPLSDADVLAWAVVLSYRARQERDGISILLLPYPPCPICGESVYEAEQVTFDRPDRLVSNIQLTVQPCGHVHTTSDECVRRLWRHIHEMTSDVASGYHGQAIEARRWTTEEIVREARARVAGTATESDDYPAPAVPAEQPAAQPSAEDVVRLEGALHVLRYALDRFIRVGYNPAPEFLRDLIDKVTNNPGEPCDRDQQYARAETAETAVARARAESARIRAVTRTWEPVANLIDAALDGPIREQRERPTHPDGTPYRYHEIKAEGWGHCDGCRLWTTGTTARPHQCTEAHIQGPVDGKETPHDEQ